jgi:hypothetical protein
MNLQTARRRGLWSGYIVRMIGAGDGLVRYLCDWKAQPDQASTDVPDEAAYFFTLELARDAALFAGMTTGIKWVAVATAPQESAINGRVVKPIPAGSVLEPGITPREAQMAFDAAVMAFQLESDDLDDELEADSYALDFTRRERRIVAREIDLLDATRAVLESERPGLPTMFPLR